MCLTGTEVTSWSLTQEVRDLNPFTAITNIFVSEFIETFSKNSIGWIIM